MQPDQTNDDRALFDNPTAVFRPSAYWFWHSIPTADICHGQLADFKRKGFGTILIQARLAMPLDQYLSPRYLEAYRLAAEIAATLGLKLGIYDDYNWISGHAGGRTVSGCDAVRERHLFWSSCQQVSGEISGIHPPFVQKMGADILQWQYEGGRIEWCEWTIEAALLHPSCDVGCLDHIIDVTASMSITASNSLSCTYTYDGQLDGSQTLTVFVSARSATSRLINYLLPEAAQRYIEVGLEPLTNALGNLVPDPVGFLFYDQPAAGFYRWDQISGNLGNSLLFAPSLPHTILRSTGKPFRKVLLGLLRDIGPDTLRLRAQFHASYSALMNEAFSGTLRIWAEAKRMTLTGHEILPHVGSWSLNGGFTTIDPRVALSVDFFGIDALRHETAVDSNNFAAQLAPKLGDSVARSNGRSRCMVETYASAERTPVRAAGQWELTLETMRAQAIRLYCLGARQFLWHGVYQTDGHANDPTPFTNPRFDFAPGINFEPWWSYHDLFAQETARISAFIEPATPHAPVAILYPLHTAFAEGPRHSHATHVGAWCEGLLSQACDVMFISETDLATARITDGRLLVSGMVFDAVILPSITVLATAEALQTLDTFRNAGGIVWSSGDRLSSLCHGEHSLMDVATTHVDHMPGATDIRTLVSLLPSHGPQINGHSRPRPWQWVGYEADGWWRMVLFNDSPDDIVSEISFGNGFDCEIWHAATGKVEDLFILRSLKVALGSQDVCCIRLRSSQALATRDGHTSVQPMLDHANTQLLGDGWTFAAGHDAAFVPISVDKGWEKQGFAEFSGTGIYRLNLDVAQGYWLLELPDVDTAVTVFIDGQQVDRRGWRPYRFELGRLAKGCHLLELHVANTAANRYYTNTPYLGDTIDKSGLSATPQLIPLTI